MEGRNSMAPEFTWWEDDLDLAAYRENRAALLNKIMLDHLVWVQSLTQFGAGPGLEATWIDGDGQDHVTAINQEFIDAHLRILRSVMHDLEKCGPEGQIIIRDIFADHFAMLHEQDDAHS
jgi:hypothetical protein